MHSGNCGSEDVAIYASEAFSSPERRPSWEATVKRFHYDTHDELRSHLADFVSAYNFAKRLKTLKGLTPYEYICTAWTKDPERFTLNPSSKCRD